MNNHQARDVTVFFTKIYGPGENGRIVEDQNKIDIAIISTNSPIAIRYLENRDSSRPPIQYGSLQSVSDIAISIFGTVGNYDIEVNTADLAQLFDMPKEVSIGLVQKLSQGNQL